MVSSIQCSGRRTIEIKSAKVQNNMMKKAELPYHCWSANVLPNNTVSSEGLSQMLWLSFYIDVVSTFLSCCLKNMNDLIGL